MRVWTTAAAATVASFLLGASLATIALQEEPHSGASGDCADTVARAFERQHLGHGAWVCLSPGKQDEFSAAGIDDDATLAQAAIDLHHDYDASTAIGSLPRVGRSPIRVFLLTRAVQTHELAGRQLRPAAEREGDLLLVSLDAHGKVDQVGFVGTGDDG